MPQVLTLRTVVSILTRRVQERNTFLIEVHMTIRRAYGAAMAPAPLVVVPCGGLFMVGVHMANHSQTQGQ